MGPRSVKEKAFILNGRWSHAGPFARRLDTDPRKEKWLAMAHGAHASIWDRPEQGRRGPRPRHDRADIAKIAVRIADAEGLDAVTMRRVAGEAGVAVMSLYKYVPAKEQLTELMADQVAAEYVYPPAPAPDPGAAIVGLATQARDIARRHPWLAGQMQRPLAPGPNRRRYLDYFRGLLAGSGLEAAAQLEFIAMIGGFAAMSGALRSNLPARSADDIFTSCVKGLVDCVMADAAATTSHVNNL